MGRNCSFSVNSTTGLLSRTNGSDCGDPACQYLDMSGLDIKAIATDAFLGMVHLKVLSLGRNQLSSISYEHLKDLVELEDLDLSFNSFSSIVPGTFSGLSTLSKLNLGYNNIGYIGEDYFVGLPNLRHLDLVSRNYNAESERIGYIEDGSFRHMPRLETLKITYHSLSRISNDMFSGLPNLKLLDLKGREDASTKKELVIEVWAFAGLSKLETLYLSHAAVRDESLRRGLFWRCGKIVYLDMGHNPITTLMRSTFAGLENSLVQLHLQSCLIDTVKSRTFRRLSTSKLNYINLRNNSLSTLHLDVFANMPYLDGTFVSHYGHHWYFQGYFRRFAGYGECRTNYASASYVDLMQNRLACKPISWTDRHDCLYSGLFSNRIWYFNPKMDSNSTAPQAYPFLAMDGSEWSYTPCPVTPEVMPQDFPLVTCTYENDFGSSNLE